MGDQLPVKARLVQLIIIGGRTSPMIKVSLYCKGDWYMSQVSEKAVSFEPEEKKEKKEWKINVFAMLLVLLIIAAVITHILPAGKYEQIEKNGYTTVDPNSFKWIE